MKRAISPACLQMSGYFFKDCYEYIWRYELCVNDDRFSGIKSWDTKLFIDLRMAYEAILKAIAIYYSCRDKTYEVISKKIEKYKHNLDKLAKDITYLDNVPTKIKECIANIDKEIHEIPVGLRYSFDTYEFVESREEFYYRTLRSDNWVTRLHLNICLLQTALQNEFDSLPLSYSSVTISDLVQDLFRLKKYHKKDEN